MTENASGQTSTDPTAPNTIVLVHGLWETPRSWEEVADYALEWAEANATRPAP
jgi:alpha-beta hydrolase superfamily lysophospholipase